MPHVLIELLRKSSIYAISQLAHSHNFRRRIFWAIMLIVGFVGLIYEVNEFLFLYFQYPVVITLEVQSGRKLNFPGVTVCNLNRMKSEYISCMYEDSMKCSIPEDEMSRNKRSAPFISATYNHGFSGFEEDKNQKENYASMKLQKIDHLNTYANLNASDRKQYGYKADELIISCTYNGETCSDSNFTHFESMQYGNCYTFNGKGTGDKSLKTKYTGPNSSGLELILDLKIETYTLMTPAIGARVIIHEPTTDPNPENYGLNVNPGEETSMAMEMNTIQRLPPPYRDRCKEYNSDDYSSSYETCFRLCILNLSLISCSCVDPTFSSKSNIPQCNLNDVQQVSCLNKVLDIKNDQCDCPLPCLTTDYGLSISTASWPPPHFKGRLRPVVQKKVTPKTNLVPSTGLLDGDFRKNYRPLPTLPPFPFIPSVDERFSLEEIRENEAKLKIFFQTLQVKSYKQEPMFQESELFSQLGGQMGLWLGLSIVAMFECIEGMLHFIHFCLYKGLPVKKK